MCGSMADIQSATAEIRQGNKRRRRRKKKKPQDENIMVSPIPQGKNNYRTKICRHLLHRPAILSQPLTLILITFREHFCTLFMYPTKTNMN